jgi:antitoxin Phd
MEKTVSKKSAPNRVLTSRSEALPSHSAWQIQTAKARFSEVFRLARSRGPQYITRQGKEAVVMISKEHYEELVGRSHQPQSLVQFFRESPLVGIDLDLERGKDKERLIEL